MGYTYFQATLTVLPKTGGAAELVLPKALQKMDCQFVIIKDGGMEGIVRIEASESVIKKIEADESCKKLTAKQVESIQKNYPAPKLKQVFRERDRSQVNDSNSNGQYEVDSNGAKVIDTYQTVRAGFYLIDVPVSTEKAE